MKSADRRAQILSAAARLFEQRRFDEVLMDDIAHAASVAKGTLYSHFADKEELYFAVVFDGICQLNTRLREEAAHASDPPAQLRAIVHAIVAFFTDNRVFFRLMAAEDARSATGRSDHRRRWQRQRDDQISAISDVLEAGAKTGVFRVTHAHVQAEILRGMVRSVLMSRTDELGVEDHVDIILESFLQGVHHHHQD
ncbi:MAG: TetR/AcrR family transcriptional regulator [Gemmatimonadetes bacterium]|jgi:AcrR family transcriptional regulator|nr:TetR/AcrR family transcriptional regulator [Gemmatimonadota bacterium]MBT6147699.1 TetR/AcrR family transcriptional regulator [Gemmatimonadota bacterium]MBT7862317.1 TetR/AcrR family transcriptional regulator [Gemmatimonadota bacterium]